MASTALYTPAHRVMSKSPNASPDAAPSIDYGGSGLQDPRLPYNFANSPTGMGVVGWHNAGAYKTVSQVPSTLATANIAALANVVSGVAMTKVSVTGAGITVVATGGFVPFPNYSQLIPAGTLAIDGLPGYLRVGAGAITGLYDPTKGICRAVTISGVASGTGGTFTVRGFDWYGYPMSQLVTVGAGANTVTSLKCFKFISSITPNFTDAHNYSVGTADVFGLNLAAEIYANTECFWDNVLQLFATFTAADTTSPATTATGDVRGKFGPFGTASNGVRRLDMFVAPAVGRIVQVPQSTGLFGIPQV